VTELIARSGLKAKDEGVIIIADHRQGTVSPEKRECVSNRPAADFSEPGGDAG
jgi:hypothetical protein